MFSFPVDAPAAPCLQLTICMAALQGTGPETAARHPAGEDGSFGTRLRFACYKNAKAGSVGGGRCCRLVGTAVTAE